MSIYAFVMTEPGMQQKLDISSIFTVHNLEESTVLRLLDASTNADIARYFNNDFFLGMLHDVQGNPGFDKRTQLAAGRLSNRIHQWHVFEDALSNTRGDFRVSAQMLKDIGNEEHALGSFLQTMMNHDNVVAKLAENPVLPSQSHPPLLLHSTLTSVSHGDFITFVRAFIGVSSVLAVWAWADSLGNDECREQTLAVIRLWQGVDGYREVGYQSYVVIVLTFNLLASAGSQSSVTAASAYPAPGVDNRGK